MDTFSVKDMVAKYLSENESDGLCHPDTECGCDGSAPCGEGPFPDCLAAQKHDGLYYPTEDTWAPPKNMQL
jgi:hypothetical protein